MFTLKKGNRGENTAHVDIVPTHVAILNKDDMWSSTQYIKLKIKIIKHQLIGEEK